MANEVEKLNTIAIADIEKFNLLADSDIEKINGFEFAGISGFAVFYGGNPGSVTNVSNLVSSVGVVASDTSGVGTARQGLCGTEYGGDNLGIFLFGVIGSAPGYLGVSNLVNSSGVVGSDVTAVASVKGYAAGTEYGGDKAIFAFGHDESAESNTRNLVSNSGVVASDASGAGTARRNLVAMTYGSGQSTAIFLAGDIDGTDTGVSNLVNSSGVVASDTTAVATANYGAGGLEYGGDKAIMAFGSTADRTNDRNLISNSGVVGSNVSGAGTARNELAGCGTGQ